MAPKTVIAFRYKTEVIADITKHTSEFKKADETVTKYGKTVQKVGKETAKAFDGVSAGKRFGKDFSSQAVAEIGSTFSVSTLGGLIGTLVAPGIGTTVGSAVGSGIDAALSKVAPVILNQIHRGIELNDLLEDTRVEFTQLTGTEKEANKYLDELLGISKDLGILPGIVIDTSEKLSDLTGNLKLTRTLLKASADQAADFAGTSFDKVASDLGLIAERGEFIARDFKTLLKDGINAKRYLTEATGLTEKQLDKMIAAGRIRGDVATRLIAEGIEREKGGIAAYKTSQTSRGRKNQFNVGMEILSAHGTENIAKTQGELYGQLYALINGPKAEKLVRSIDSFAGFIIDLTKGGITKAINLGDGVIGGMLNFDPATMLRGINGIVGDMETMFKTVLKMQSPSQWAAEKLGIPIGLGILQGINTGVLSGGSDLQRAFVKILSGDLRPKLDEAASKYGIPVELLAALIAQESRGNPRAVSPKGAKGLAQFMPGTAAAYGIRGREFDPVASINASAHLLSDLLKDSGGNVPDALAHYNWSGRGQMPAETRDYIAKITGLLGGNSSVVRGVSSSMGAGIYGGVPIGEMSTLSLSGAQAKQLDELNGILKQYRELLAELEKRISQAESKAAGGDVRAGIELTSQGGLRDVKETYRGKIADYERQASNFVTGIRSERAADEALKAGLPLVRLNPELPKLDDSVTLLTSDLRELTFTGAKANPELWETNFALKTLGLGLPPLMKGVQEFGDTSIQLTKEYQEASREQLVRAQGVMTQLSGMLGQAAGMIPGQEVGRKRSLFSKILGIAAPFLSFIPGAGPILSTIAGIAGNAVGGNYGAAVSGIAGGLQAGGVFRSSGGGAKEVEHRAMGGPVYAGRPYLIRDRADHRPELFVPDRDGQIFPPGQFGAGGGGLQPEHVALLERLHNVLSRIEGIDPRQVVSMGAHGMIDAMDSDAGLIRLHGQRLRLA